MKTTISIPAPLFAAAERVSKRLGMSRSRFYAMAIEKALGSNFRQGVKETLEAVYAVQGSRLTRQPAAMQSASLLAENEEW
jgi:metal-responsive CopG/Arc/MetJ family transcriptional regulator